MKIDLSKFDKLTNKQWKDKIVYRGLHIKYKHQLNSLKKLYPEKIEKLQNRFDLLHPLTLKITFQDYGKLVEIYGLDFCLDKKLAEIQPIIVEEIEYLESKIERLTDKYGAVLKEIELRDKKLVKRNPKGTIYYIDLDNGNDARTGLKIGPSTIDSTADTTHFIDDFLTGADDYINGSFVWNVTRSAGSLITDFVAATDEVTLATPITGMTAGDTYYILDAWLTLGQYTTVTARTAGDIAKVRANTSQVLADNLLFDEEGNVDNLITIKGCSSTDDPWGDVSDVRPIINFNNTIYYMSLNTDDCWKFQNLDFMGGNSVSYGCIKIADTENTFFDNCRIYENGQRGIYLLDGNRIEIENCEFYSNISTSLYILSKFSDVTIKGSTFNGGVDATFSGITNASSVSNLILIDCSFGQTTAHTTSDIKLYNSELIMRNCIYNTIIYDADTEKARKVYSEDDGQVFEAQKVDTYDVTIERDTSVTRPGGADSSLKMIPSANVGLYRKVSSFGEQGEIVRGTFKIWLSADVEKTINIYIKGFGWTGFPTASQLFIRASYLSNAGNASRTEIDSDEVIADNTTWVPFQITLTPARDGFVYVDAFIAHYEASSGINIDIDTSNIT